MWTNHSVKILGAIGLVAIATAVAGFFYWEDAGRYGTKAEAEAIVKAVVASMKSDQKKTFADITAREAKWHYKDLYPVVYSMSGTVYAHGLNEKNVGLNLYALQDPEGKLFVKERIDLALSKSSFWHDYTFTDPITRKVLPKEAYCEKINDFIVCTGIYQR